GDEVHLHAEGRILRRALRLSRRLRGQSRGQAHQHDGRRQPVPVQNHRAIIIAALFAVRYVGILGRRLAALELLTVQRRNRGGFSLGGLTRRRALRLPAPPSSPAAPASPLESRPLLPPPPPRRRCLRRAPAPAIRRQAARVPDRGLRVWARAPRRA